MVLPHRNRHDGDEYLNKYSTKNAKTYLLDLAENDQPEFINLLTKVIVSSLNHFEMGTRAIISIQFLFALQKAETPPQVDARGILTSIQNSYGKLLANVVETAGGVIDIVKGQDNEIPDINEAEEYLLHLLRDHESDFIRVVSYVLRRLPAEKSRMIVDHLEQRLAPELLATEYDNEISETPESIRNWFVAYVSDHKPAFIKMAVKVLVSLISQS